jgi:uncharacterized iron-regulated protein
MLRPALAALLMMLMLSPLAALAAPLPAPTLPADHPLAGRIWHPATGQFLSPEALAALLAPAQAVLLGETHDNPDHHAAQAWAVRELAAAGGHPLVAFEMIDRDRQGDLDARPSDLDGLGAALTWEARGWPAWSLYRPIAEAALAAGGGLAAANLPAESTRQIARRNEPADLAARLGLDIPLADEDTLAMADEIRASHCNMMPESAIPAMVRVQRARDSEMAETILDLSRRPGQGPVVLIAGAGHARSDRGVPARLRRIAPDLRVISVGFIEVESGATDPAAYAERFRASALPFDAVWFTGRAEREDSCAQLQRHMKKRNDGK